MALLDEIATLFASAPAPEQILEYQPSEDSRNRSHQLLELAKADQLDADSRTELAQVENLELLIRMTKAKVRGYAERSGFH